MAAGFCDSRGALRVSASLSRATATVIATAVRFSVLGSSALPDNLSGADSDRIGPPGRTGLSTLRGADRGTQRMGWCVTAAFFGVCFALLKVPGARRLRKRHRDRRVRHARLRPRCAKVGELLVITGL